MKNFLNIVFNIVFIVSILVIFAVSPALAEEVDENLEIDTSIKIGGRKGRIRFIIEPAKSIQMRVRLRMLAKLRG